MLRFRTLVMFVVVAMATVEGPFASGTQSAPADQPDSISIHISLEKNSYAEGEKPIVVMTIKNISSTAIWFSRASHLYRVHVTSKGGEPPKTEFHRHRLGDFRPGDGPGLDSGPVAGWSIAPGSVSSLKYDLAAFYDLRSPGDYSAYLEVYDPSGPEDGSGHWVRSNTAKFTIQAPSQ
jgi:hypothetical protein